MKISMMLFQEPLVLPNPEIEEDLNKSHVNGWDGPGEEVNLEFLQSTEHGAI